MADRPEDAVAPVDAALTACGRAVDMPVAGSALPGGHSPRVGFFRAAQLPDSGAVGVVPFACTEGAVSVAVEVVELVDASEEDEFCRCTVFRGPGENILVASSEFIAP